jgi:16S rRNA C967 or C1407 C5-methylase (RsmB/RsmF family)
MLHAYLIKRIDIPLLLFTLIISTRKNPLSISSNLSTLADKLFVSNSLDILVQNSYVQEKNPDANKLEECISKIGSFLYKIDDISNASNNPKHLELRFSMPRQLINELQKSFEEPALYTLLKNLSKQANVYLWYKDKEELVKDLEKNEIDYTLISERAIALEARPNLIALDSYKKGLFEIQDISSQIISEILLKLNSNNILDACAGAGGKSLYLAANSDKDISAYDIRLDALKELKKRAKRMRLKNIKTLESKHFKENPIYETVFIDSPCSGFGTIKRDPALKHKLTLSRIKDFHRKQLKLLNFYRNFVAENGYLVYATCSLLHTENQSVIHRFLADNPGFNFGLNIRNFWYFSFIKLKMQVGSI